MDGSARRDVWKETGEAVREPSEFGADSIRMYLRDMGALRLLTRDEEVSLATQMEDGERAVLRAVLASGTPARRTLATAYLLVIRP